MIKSCHQLGLTIKFQQHWMLYYNSPIASAAHDSAIELLDHKIEI